MKRLAALILALCLPVIVSAEPVLLDEPRTGTFFFPEDADEDHAVYMYRYSFPSVSGDTAFAEGVNTFFSDYLEDAAAFTVPINGESIESTDEVSTTDISKVENPEGFEESRDVARR